MSTLRSEPVLRLAMTLRVACSAFETVGDIGKGIRRIMTLTGGTFEGGQHTGQVNFPKIMYLQCVLSRLSELDPTIETGALSVTFASFNSRFLEL